MNTRKDRAYSQATAVTPSDTVALSEPCRALYIGGAGAVSVQMGGETSVFSAVPVGTILPIVASRVNATGTTATLILALN